MIKNKDLQTRLEQDENMWLKMQEQLGDFAREILKAHERINKLTERVQVLENEKTKTNRATV